MDWSWKYLMDGRVSRIGGDGKLVINEEGGMGMRAIGGGRGMMDVGDGKTSSLVTSHGSIR